jgi:hypothetical protein
LRVRAGSAAKRAGENNETKRTAGTNERENRDMGSGDAIS